jgi:hypothetical protein
MEEIAEPRRPVRARQRARQIPVAWPGMEIFQAPPLAEGSVLSSAKAANVWSLSEGSIMQIDRY